MNKQNRLLTICFAVALICGVPTVATTQVVTGGTYSLDQAVIASGGVQNSTGGTFKVEGTIGQTIAGTRSTNSPFILQGGFWGAQNLPPTAATVSISGRILTPDTKGLQNARVTLTDMRGNSQTILSGALGYYIFENVTVGETVIIMVFSRRYQFQPQFIFVIEEMSEINFLSAP